jgi:transcriptional regulator with XRE-family HTH domain
MNRGLDYQFPELILSHMQIKGVERNELAKAVRRSPEHIRKLEMGEAFPSIDLQEKLADFLGIDREKFTDVIQADRWYKMTRKRPPKSSPASPIDKFWDHLSGEQRKTIVCVAECFARSNRRKKA